MTSGVWGILGLLGGFVGIASVIGGEAAPRFQKDVAVRMSDETNLAAHVFLPAAGGPFPVVLMRTPYGKPEPDGGEVLRYTRAGYAMVVQDCRGRGQSGGEWDPFRDDPQDGPDTLKWVADQTWCNGRIGTAGGSYLGWTQWALAPKAGPKLRAMVPMVPFGDVYDNIAYPGGAFQLALAFGWGTSVSGVAVDQTRFPEYFRHLPLNRWDEQFDRRIPYLSNWIAHPTRDSYWLQRSITEHLGEVTAPALNIGGWYDIFSKVTLELSAQVREKSKDSVARQNQRVVMGPWAHGVGGRKTGELDFGEAAQLDVADLQFRWLEHWLKDSEPGVTNWPPVRIFVMGENRWRDEREWPLARTQFEQWHLHSGGSARSRSGDGSLHREAPNATETPDTFTYDPLNPIPTHGGNNLVGANAGPYDQGKLEDRPDILVYTSAPLAAPLEVTGPVKLILFASSSAPDTDFTAKLVDVYPDGPAYNLCDGIQRAAYRKSTTSPTAIEPRKVYRFEIDLWVTSNVFLPGHRVRLEVSSSNFPRFDRNPNTGAAFGTDRDLRTAQQTILHDRDHPSHLLLPVIPRTYCALSPATWLRYLVVRVDRSIIQRTSLLLADGWFKFRSWPFFSTGLVRASCHFLISEWPSTNENPAAPLW